MKKIKKRSLIEALAERLEISIAEMSRETSIPSISLYKTKTDRNITPKLIKKITKVYKDVNPDFLRGEDERILLTDADPNEGKAPRPAKTYATPGERVKAIRNKKAMTVDEFAKYLGVNRPTLAAVEHGSNQPNLNLLIRLKKRKLISCMDEIVDGTNAVLEASQNTNLGEINKLNQTIVELTKQNKELMESKNSGKSTNSEDYNELQEKYKKLLEDYDLMKKMVSRLV
jgi:transcriptional regulator with XRE-family HTH domain